MCSSDLHSLRAIMSTALVAAIGFVPAALASGTGAEVQRPLATVVVGGMLIGPIMLLIIVPALRLLLVGKHDEAVPGTARTSP